MKVILLIGEMASSDASDFMESPNSNLAFFICSPVRVGGMDMFLKIGSRIELD